jgi:replicative DNA helicase
LKNPVESDRDPLIGSSQRVLPANLEAEQALLGTILANNKAFDRVSDTLKPEFFADSAHAQIYDAIERLCRSGQSADPVSLRGFFQNSAALDGVGGIGYLSSLLRAMTGIVNAPTYAQAIVDCWMRRQLIERATEILERAYGDNTRTPVEQLRLAEGELGLLTLPGEEAVIRTMAEATQGVLDQVDQARAGTAPAIFSTGILPLDDLIGGGLRDEQEIIIGGRPGHGKSALAMQIARHIAAIYGIPILYVSIEMAAEELAARLLGADIGIPAWRIESGRISPQEANQLLAAKLALDQVGVYFDDRPRQTCREIENAVRRFKQKYGKIGMLVVDHMHIMKPDSQTLKSAGLTYAVGEISQDLKALAKAERIPVLVLGQLNRSKESSEDKVPTIGDLRNSGDIEANADTVILVHRPELHLQKVSITRKMSESDTEFTNRQINHDQALQSAAGKAQLIVGKARKGITGGVEMMFDGPTTSFLLAGNAH